MNPTILLPLLRGAALKILGEPVFIQLQNEATHTDSVEFPITTTATPTDTEKQDSILQNYSGLKTLASNVINTFENIKLPNGSYPASLQISGIGQVHLGRTFNPSPEKGKQLSIHPPQEKNNGVNGRIALVTGGAQGFGAEIVRGLVQDGAFVFIVDINKDGAQKLANKLNANSIKTMALQCDVSNEESVAELANTIARQTGGLDLVISNAGVLRAGSVLEQSQEDFTFVTQINYTAFFLLVKHLSPLLIRQNMASSQSSDIIQINSKSGLEGSNKNAAYAGSKFGSIGLIQSFAKELVEYNIKVNAICPGNFFDGPLWSDPESGLFVQYLKTGKVPGAQTLSDVRNFYETKVPMKRGCSGEDVLRAIIYCVEQQYETGQSIPVTGGQIMLN